MSIKKHIALPAALILIVMFGIRGYLLQPPEDVTLPNGAQLKWSSCEFRVPLNKIIHCARLYPSMNNVQQAVSLPIFIFKDYSLQHKFDPVLFINGGPGSSSSVKQYTDYWVDYIDDLGWNRDFVVFDQRGTGDSSPKPECKELLDYYLEELLKNSSLQQEFSEGYKRMQRCYQRLEGQYQLANFSTLISSQDVHDLIGSMSSTDWNLFGVSYGTRLALEVMRQTPRNVRSVILDSVYPSGKHFLLNRPGLLNNSVEMMFKYCEDKEKCNREHPDLREKFFETLRALHEKPMRVRAYSYELDDFITVIMNDQRLLNAMFMAMYYSDTMADLPAAIYGLLDGDSAAAQPVVEAYVDWMLDSTFNDMIYYSVECNDAESITAKSYQDEVERYPALRKYLRYDWRYSPCRFWIKRDEKTLSTEPVHSNIPTLILSGEYDPITPWQWGEEVQKSLSNSVQFVYKNIGHSVIDSDECALLTSRRFLNNPQHLPDNDCR